MWTASTAEHVGGAKRRRERRLSVHTESNHHSAPRPRGQNMARAGEEGHEEKHIAPWRLETTRSTPPTSSSRRSITKQSIHTPFPQVMERTMESQYVEPGPAAVRRRRTGKYGASAPAAVYAAPATVMASSPADTYALPATVTEHASSPSPAMAYAGPTPVIDSAASAPAYSCASPAPVTTSADFYAAPAPAIEFVVPRKATDPVIESVASAPAVTDTGPAHVSSYVAPSLAVSNATPCSLIKSEASAPAVKTPVRE